MLSVSLMTLAKYKFTAVLLKCNTAQYTDTLVEISANISSLVKTLRKKKRKLEPNVIIEKVTVLANLIYNLVR